jgi:hypothetical protein
MAVALFWRILAVREAKKHSQEQHLDAPSASAIEV